MIRRRHVRNAIFWGFPISLAIVGYSTTLPDYWGDSCAVPCFDVIWYTFVTPWTASWATVGEYGGLAGQALFVITAILWLIVVFGTLPIRAASPSGE